MCGQWKGPSVRDTHWDIEKEISSRFINLKKGQDIYQHHAWGSKL